MLVTLSGDGVQVVGIHITEFSEYLLIVLVLILIVSLFRIMFAKIPQKLKVMPESGVVIILGCIIGLILFGAGVGEHELLTFNSEVFFLLLIPPVIFESGYHLNNVAFFTNIRLILLYALVGTFINTVSVGICIWLLNPLFIIKLGLAEALTFGALISAVDPVAVIAIFDEVHVNQTLNILVFGESVLNDAVSIVLYSVFSALIHVNHITWVVPGLALSKFFWVAIGGLIMGILFGLACSFLTRFTNGHEIVFLEPIFVAIFAMLAFVVAEILLMSGIVSVLFAGIVMSRYVEMNVGYKSHLAIKYMVNAAAIVADTLIFTYLGISTIFHIVEGDVWDPALICFTLIFIIVFRFILVFVITFFENRVRLDKVSLRDQFIISYGGLRGAIAFALAFLLDEEEVDARGHIITATLVVIWFTVFIMGTTIKPVLSLLNVRRSQDRKQRLAEKTFTYPVQNILSCVNIISGHAQQAWYMYIWHWIDHQITFICVRKLHEGEEELLNTLTKQRKDQPAEAPQNVNMSRMNKNLRNRDPKKRQSQEVSMTDLGNRLNASMNIPLTESHRMGSTMGE
eukprot:CAMPEP_0206199984 /NCGR_PEP_ID=MMETSP0166-20121206/10593_1 /ASSEMBLY_ACC=CAM_ASM_000260 /TAXON_ID=95228 /ORGANISM="Vannella robusta, Strain DIVA3 518/3/11/1/6" /LENGTH=569 /DNA_ID=CAMNT_0053618203 /DNA_START=30 /DNA_END=1736 /DNA_ORIENTATION=-